MRRRGGGGGGGGGCASSRFVSSKLYKLGVECVLKVRRAQGRC